MKHLRIRQALLAAMLVCALFALSACGAGNSTTQSPTETTEESTSSTDPAGTGETQSPDAAPSTLEELLGADYKDYIVETITMQMENRMDLEPEVEFYPVRDNKPLTDYVAIDETLSFTPDEEGGVTIHLPAGSVTDEAHGEQSFSLPNPHP